MEPSVSKAWSSGSLEDSLKLAKTQHSAYKTAEIEEAAMQEELAATWPNTARVKIIPNGFNWGLWGWYL